MKKLSCMIAACFLSILLWTNGIQAQIKFSDGHPAIKNDAGQTAYYITSKDGTKLYVQEFGQGSPVVLLAGGPGLNAIYLNSNQYFLTTKNLI